MRRKTMALFTIAIHFYRAKFLLLLYPYKKLHDATKGRLFLLKPRPNALDISLDSARQMSSDVLLFQRGVAKRSRLSLDFSLDSSQTRV